MGPHNNYQYNSMGKDCERTGCTMVLKIGNNQKNPQGWKISNKYDILIFQDKRVALIVNKTEISLEITRGKKS